MNVLYSKVLDLYETAGKNLRCERYDQAYEQYKNVLSLTRRHKLHKNHPLENLVYSTYKNVGQIYFAQADYSEAIKYFNKALSFDNSDVLVTSKIADGYYQLEKYRILSESSEPRNFIAF